MSSLLQKIAWAPSEWAPASKAKRVRVLRFSKIAAILWPLNGIFASFKNVNIESCKLIIISKKIYLKTPLSRPGQLANFYEKAHGPSSFLCDFLVLWSLGYY